MTFSRMRSGLAMVCAVLFASSSAAAPPASDDTLEIGARFQLQPGLAPNTFAALLFLDGDWNTAIKVCQQYKDQYEDRLDDKRPYKKIVYFLKKKTYAGTTIECPQLTKIYDPNAISTYDGDLKLSDRGDGPFLVIILRDPGGRYHNKGYVNFADANDTQIRGKFKRFNTYYHCTSGDWEDDRLIDDDSFLSKLTPRKCK